MVTSVRKEKYKNEQKFKELFFQGQYSDALKISLKAYKSQKLGSLEAMEDTAVCYVYLEDWESAYNTLKKCLLINPKRTNILDGLAHSSLGLGKIEEVNRYGTLSLTLKNSESNIIDWMPSERKPYTPYKKNVISFSLYGSNPKYCETACINVTVAKEIYPDWVCRFYVDESVPNEIKQRLKDNGAEVYQVTSEEEKKLPGTMWRFLAADDESVDFIIFRDCDSIVSKREKQAVQEWLTSDRHFHVIRDFASHTELVLAGMWGMARDPAMPKLLPMMTHFIERRKHPTHIDQYFLRLELWPYMRDHVLQHDSYFSFGEVKPVPGGLSPTGHIGDDQSAGTFAADMPQFNNQIIKWGIVKQTETGNQLICRYQSMIKNNQLKINLPKDYIMALRSGEFTVMLYDS